MVLDIRMIAVDMDGTLLDGDHITIPARNVEALRAAAAQGCKIVIASGRSWCLAEEAVRTLGVVDYAVLANGASVLDVRTGAWLFRAGMPRAQYEAVIAILRSHNIPFEVYCNGKSYVDRRYGACWERLWERMPPAYAPVVFESLTFVDDLEEALSGGVVEKFNIFFLSPQTRQALLKELEAAGPLVSASASGENLELTRPEADKGKALERLCRRLNIPARAVLACGDGGNDLGMLSWCGCSVAMENATPEAKAAAGYVTLPNTQGGVGAAVEKFVLGM